MFGWICRAIYFSSRSNSMGGDGEMTEAMNH